MAGRLEFNFRFGRPQNQSNPSPEDDTPLRILVLGNFSGADITADRQPRLPLLQRKVSRIDIDNFDQVMARFAPHLNLGTEGATSTAEVLEFRELEDFRPEQLGKKLNAVSQLQELRKKLLSPASFAQAAAELRQGLLADTSLSQQTAKTPSTPVVTSAEDDAATLERILGQRPSNDTTTAKGIPGGGAEFNFHQLISQAVGPYIVPKADPHQGVYLAAIDQAIGDQIRGVLHTPSFQTLEASWRSLRNLISNIEDDGQIQIHLLDVTYEELLADVPTDDEQLSQWSLFRRLTNDSIQPDGTSRWSLIVGDYQFAARPNDLALLSALAVTVESLQTPFISSAHSSLLGCPSLTGCPDPTDWQPLDAETRRYWQALRQSSAAAWVGLALPRVLLRMPYGKATAEVEGFAFEEFSQERRHEDYLWGNPAYVCAEIIAAAFAEDAWSMQLGSQLDIVDLPAYTYLEDGEKKLQPCAEVAFGERTADAMLTRGLMPLLSWKDRNMVRFLRFQSIADPISPLSGPWS